MRASPRFPSDDAPAGAAALAPTPAPPPGADLRELLVTAWRGKWLVLALAVAATAAALGVLSRIAPVYEAEAKVLLDTRGQRVANITEVVGALAVDNAVTASEISVIRSEALLEETARRLALDKLPAFADPKPGLRAAAQARLSALTGGWIETPEPDDAPPLDRARARLAQALTVSQEGRSYVIRVAIRLEDPALAAAVANGVAETYLMRQAGARRDATSQASGWLSDRIDALRAEVETADAAVEAFKARQTEGVAGGAEVTTQQLAEVNRALVSARAGRAEAEARRDEILRLIEAEGQGAAANILTSPLIVALRQQRAEAKRRRAELATRYGKKHPKMINATAELADVNGAIAAEAAKLVAGLKTDAEVARAREATLAAELAAIEDRSTDLSRANVGLRQLEREAEAARRIYENFLDRWKETTEAEALPRSDARVISDARPPRAPAAPKSGAIAAFAGFGGAFVGLALVFLGELMENTFRTGAAAERALGLPLFARMPRVRGRRTPLEALRRNPNSAFAEAARGLRNALLLARLDTPPKVVMVTSAAPGEGKTSTCLALAHMTALAGKRAVVVECDMRRPRLAREGAEGVAGAPDLLSVLRGEAFVEDALTPLRGETEGAAFILPVRRAAPQAADILGAAAFADLVRALAADFDLILLDTPPALAVADAAAAGRVADACLFAVRWRSTPAQAAAEALRRLREMGVAPLGFALTQVNPKKEAAYEYGGYRAGAPDYTPYYA